MDAAVTVFIEGPAGSESQWENVPAIQVDHGRVSVSASGMMLSPKILLTSMVVFYPFLKGAHDEPCSVLCDPELVPTTAVLVRQGAEEMWIAAKLCWGIRLGQCDSAFAPLQAKGWTCGYRDGTLGAFGVAVLQLESPMQRIKPVYLELHRDADVQVGDDIQLFASPFSVIEPVVFTRSTTKGCLASIDSSKSLYLLDVRMYCGGEGGIIAKTQGSTIVGMCAPPLSHCKNYSIFALGIPVRVIMDACANLSTAVRPFALRMLGIQHAYPVSAQGTTCSAEVSKVTASAEALSASVVILLMNGSWASGVALTSRVILTCAHFIIGSSGWMSTPSDSAKFVGTTCIMKTREVEYKATVVLVFDGFLDVALLEVEEPVLKPLRWCVPTLCRERLRAQSSRDADVSYRDDVFAESSPVKVIGFPLFGRDAPWKTPIETHGVITKTLTNSSSIPIMIQTSAAVFSGSSGGALLTPDNELLGLVTTNVRLDDGGVLPCVNFALPTTELLPALDVTSVSYPVLSERWKSRDLGEKERNLWLLKAEPLRLPSFIAERRERASEILRKVPYRARL